MLYIRSDQYTVKDLKERLMETIQELCLMDEDEIVSGTLEFDTTEEIKRSILYDRDSYDPEESVEELTKNLEFVPPHVIHTYHISAEYEARDSDDYWNRHQEAKLDIYHDEISKFFPKKEKSNENH